MKIESKKKTSAAKNSQIAKVLEKKKLGRPFKNASTHELLSDEFKKISGGKKPTAKERKAIKAIAVTMLVQGFSVTEIAETLSTPKSTVCLWRDKLDDETKAKAEQNVLNSNSRGVAEFLNGSLRSMSQMATHCSEKEYLDNHSPEQVAKLIDVLGNQAFNLIEAKQRAEVLRMSVETQVKQELQNCIRSR